MTLRRYSAMKKSAGTTWPRDVEATIRARDGGCVAARIGMEGPCWGERSIDHVRASHAMGMKSRSTVDNGAVLCAVHHKVKTENGKVWRPKLIDWIDSKAVA